MMLTGTQSRNSVSKILPRRTSFSSNNDLRGKTLAKESGSQRKDIVMSLIPHTHLIKSPYCSYLLNCGSEIHESRHLISIVGLVVGNRKDLLELVSKLLFCSALTRDDRDICWLISTPGVVAKSFVVARSFPLCHREVWRISVKNEAL